MTIIFKTVANLLLSAVIGVSSASGQKVTDVHSIFQGLKQHYATESRLKCSLRIITSIKRGENKADVDKQDGIYYLDERKAYYKFGSHETMLNDSVMISISEDDKLMVVSDAKSTDNARFFPFAESMDSLIGLSMNRYDVSISKYGPEGTSQIVFNAKNEREPVRRFMLAYDLNKQWISSVQYDSRSFEEDNSTDETVIISVLKSLKFEFSDYKTGPIDGSLFNTNNYLTYTGGIPSAAAKYAGYQFYDTTPRTTN